MIQALLVNGKELLDNGNGYSPTGRLSQPFVHKAFRAKETVPAFSKPGLNVGAADGT